jgi:cobalt-zinc-cadmium resistance protein CzcA
MKRFFEIILDKKIFIFLLLFFLTLTGIISYKNLKIDVFPDPSPVLVQIFTESEGLAPNEVEKFISYPIETSLYGLPDIEKITSSSSFSLSTVNVYFKDNIDIYFARQLVAGKLPAIQEQLPAFAEAPVLAPISTGLGMIYIYALEGDLPSVELRTLQDWVVKLQLQSIPGIAAVLSQGGDIKQFQIKINPDQLIKYKLTLHQVINRIQSASKTITAGYITKNKEEYLIRGIGLFEELKSLNKVMISAKDSTPVFLGEVAVIEPGSVIKRGNAIYNGQMNAVSGIIMKLIGINTDDLIHKIDKKISEINKGLPPGVKIKVVYNQSKIIKAAFKTISSALVIGILLVGLILLIFLNDLSVSIISTLSIPFSIFVTFIVMNLLNMTADLMSFGGLAIGIGLLVDATVVVVENIARNQDEGLHPDSFKELIIFSIRQVQKPLLYAMIMIVFAFIPLLTLKGVEGKMFKPFGFSLLTALISAIFYAIFIAPVLMSVFKSRKIKFSGNLFEKIKVLYLKIFDFSFKRPNFTLVVFIIIFIFSIMIFLNIGSEFIPSLNEQTIQLSTLLPQSTSLEETEKTCQIIDRELMKFSEIETVYTRIGKGEAGTHPHPVNSGHTILVLKDKKHWQANSQEELISRITNKIEENIPGVILSFTQPIKHNLDHLITGVKADLAIKIFGSDYKILQDKARSVQAIMSGIEGVSDLQVTKIQGLNEISVKLDRDKIARLGLNPSDILEDIEASFGGKTIGKIYQNDIVYDIFIRYQQNFRKNIKDLENYIIYTENHAQIPLSSIADIGETTGFSTIIRENGKRYITVQCNVRGRDIGSIVSESKDKVYASIKLPFGYYMNWGGQFELKEKAEKRLYFVLMITLILILILLFDFLRSSRDILIILINLPVSLCGGVLSIWLAGSYFSIPTTIGFLALFGIALENTLILISFLKRNIREKDDLDKAIRDSVAVRLRPILMTKFTTIIGLFPLLFSSGIGSEIEKPLALVVIGGIFFSIFSTLLLMPVIYKKLYKN